MRFELDKLVRENIKSLVPYSSARDEFDGDANIFLDANENSFGSPLTKNFNRYPDPLQRKVKEQIAAMNAVDPSEIFVGNGSDEAIDLLFRIFCRPGIDEAMIFPPTYGMYETAANINDVLVKRVCLTSGFELDLEGIRSSLGQNTKLIFICSPNNPTGNSMSRESILKIAESFNGIVVLDEAYIQFAESSSLLTEIAHFPNLVVLQTFSKAWGLAGLRVGLAFANKRTISLFNKVKPPYNVSQAAQELVLTAMQRQVQVEKKIAKIKNERNDLAVRMQQLSIVEKVFPSDANFLLVRTTDAESIYRYLQAKQIVVRNRSRVELCGGCLRVTIGKPNENRALLDALETYEANSIY